MKKTVLLIFALLCAVAQATWAQSSITYIERSWDAENKRVMEKEITTSNFTLLPKMDAPADDEEDDDEVWVTLDGGKNYFVSGESTYGVLNILGPDVHLILGKDCKLNLTHIKLEEGKSLYIHTEKGGIGQLIVDNSEGYDYAAGIGGGDEANSGDLYVHGGSITATGGYGGAAIGGGDKGTCGTVVIYGDTVRANGGYEAAGIGGGNTKGIRSSVTIYGGVVEAYGDGVSWNNYNHNCGAGIGGGDEGSQGGPINIYGGTVLAKALYYNGSGIGGGNQGNGGEVNIYGGTVTAIGGDDGSGIGRGYEATGSGTINISGGTVYALAATDGYGLYGTVNISGGTVVCGADTTYTASAPVNGTVNFADGQYYCVYKGSDPDKFDTTPVNMDKRLEVCYNTSSNPRDVKIAICENHHYVDFVCAYCGYEYYNTATGSWKDEGTRAEAFASRDENTKTITISTPAELGLFAYNVEKDYDLDGWTYKLANDLDMSAHQWDNHIGTFDGTFDGCGRTISGLNSSLNSEYDGGLIAHNDGVVRNVIIANSVLVGNRYVGAVVGSNTGWVENCRVGADVSVVVSNQDDESSVGGVVGLQLNNPFKENSKAGMLGCYSEASVNGYDNVGGLLGRIEAGTTITNCVSKATVNCKTPNGAKGFGVGLVDEDASISETCYYIADTKSDNAKDNRLYLVRLVSELENAGYTIIAPEPNSKYYQSYEASHLTFYTALANVLLDNKWYVPENSQFQFYHPEDLPEFDYITVNGDPKKVDSNTVRYLFETSASDNVTEYVIDAAIWEGLGTESHPYLISSTTEWNMLCRTLKNETLSGIYFKQTADIKISQGAGVTGSSNDMMFSGNYDGDSHQLECSLSNPGENSAEAVAPFHRVKDATIKNLHVSGSINGGIHSAGLVAYVDNAVTIDNCRVSAEVTCSGNSSNDAHGGGFVGHAQNSTVNVSNSAFDGKLNASANGKGDIHLGAIVGWAGANVSIENCFEAGKYQGFTDKTQTSLYWKDANNTTPDKSSSNIYTSDLGHADGATKALSVTSGTEGLELIFDLNWTWKDAYLGAVRMDKDDSDNENIREAYLVDGVFYTFEGRLVSFAVDYHSGTVSSDWYTLYANDEPITTFGDYRFYQGSEPTVITAKVAFEISDSDNNDEMIKKFEGATATVTFKDRTLYKDGSWNTLCLPFDLTISGSLLDGADVRTLTSSSFDSDTHKLTLNFTGSQNAIEAGKPYIIRWTDKGEDLKNLVFNEVIIKSQLQSANTDNVNFVGSFSPVTLKKDDRSVLYMGADNKLYYPTVDITMGACRAYFKLDDLTVSEMESGPGQTNSIVLNFGDDETTGLSTPLSLWRGAGSEAYFTLDGRRLSGKPTQPGLYIRNGEKVVIK